MPGSQSPAPRWPLWLAGTLGLLGLLRLGFWLGAFPNPDEAYYWLWGQHPGWSYYDHPPFHAWVQGLCTVLLGRSRLVLRLPNLISTGVMALTYRSILRYLYGAKQPRYGWPLALVVATSPLYFLFLAMAWNDHWLVTLALLSGYWLVRFFDGYLADGHGPTAYLYGSALALGLAGLCKYNAALVAVGYGAVVLSQRRLRPLLRDGRLYGAILLGLVILIPIALWNWQHEFYSVQFYVRRNVEATGPSLNLLQPLVFVLLCALILGPVQSWGLVRCARRPASTRSATYGAVAWAVFWSSTIPFTLLSLVAVANYYWTILAYGLLLPLVADRLVRSRHTLTVASGLGITVAALLVAHYTVIPLTALGGSADNDTAALYGWPTVAAAIDQQRTTLADPLLLTTDYRSASALAYQLNEPGVIALSGRTDQFDFWFDADAQRGRDALLLGERWHPICPAHLAMFEHTEPPITIPVRRFGRVLQTYDLVRAYGFSAPDPLGETYPLDFTTDGETCRAGP